MRKILFRGKRKDNGNFIEGFFIFDGFDHYIVKFYADENAEGTLYPVQESFEVIPGTVGQFTGLTDKNGKKIFEGDIVQGKDRLEKHLEVFGYIDHKNGSFVITGDFMTHYRWLDYEVEVIGNIHDNPELLEGE